MNIFGVSIGKETADDVFSQIESALSGKRNKMFISTLNNEILLKADKDPRYREILNKADLRIVDSMGIKVVSFLKRQEVGDRLAGADLARYILEKAVKRNLLVGAIIPSKDWGWSTKDDVEKSLSSCSDSIVLSRELNSHDVEKDAIKLSDVEILFVGLGAPHQEKYIWRIKESLPNLKIAIGIGGTLDYWTNKKKRAPKLMRDIGMEWVWRFAIQPNRVARIWDATAVFLWKALTS